MKDIQILAIDPHHHWPEGAVLPPAYLEGTRGIWLLQPGENGWYQVPDATCLRPAEEMPEMLNRLQQEPGNSPG